MHHSFFDKYSDKKSPIHSLDPRLKCIAALLVITLIVSTPISSSYSLYLQAALVVAASFLTNIPISHFIKRMMIVIPFAFIVTIALAISQSALMNLSVYSVVAFHITKVLLAVIVLTMLSGTTSYQSMIAAISYFKMPKIITSLLYFLYRFIYLLVDELEELNVARESRDFKGSIILNMRSRAWLLGTFLVRSAERSNVVYAAMAARGFDGTSPSCISFRKFSCAQLFYVVSFAVLFIVFRFGVSL